MTTKMQETITTTLAERELAIKNAAASRGGVLRFPHGAVRLTGKLPDGSTATLSVEAFSLVLGARVELSRGYSSRWEDLTDEEKETVLNYAEKNLDYPSDPEGTVEKRLAIRLMNARFIGQHGDLRESDYALMAETRTAIESAREGAIKPLPGDTVEGAYYDGAQPFKKGMLDTPYHWYEPDEISLCAQPYSPFVTLTDKRPEGYAFSMSGGPFFKLKTEDLEHIGKDTRVFTVWGHEGPCANGAIVFEAEVNRWRLKPSCDI
jgi:hypothetical protein